MSTCFEWVSLKPYNNDNNLYCMVVKCTYQSFWGKLFKRPPTIKIKIYFGNKGDWRKFPSLNKLDVKDPTISQLDDFFHVAKRYCL